MIEANIVVMVGRDRRLGTHYSGSQTWREEGEHTTVFSLPTTSVAAIYRERRYIVYIAKGDISRLNVYIAKGDISRLIFSHIAK